LLQSDFGVRIQQLNSQLQSHLDGDGPHVVMIVSVDVDEQRADAVCGLGMFTCAHRTDETLIVDADIDTRSVSRDFEKRGPGLLEAISGQVRWNDSVQATSCEKLRVLPCGSDLDMIDDASSFDQLNRVQQLVGEWKSQYGLVLIDGGLGSSPLALSMSPLVDATYVCVQLGKNRRQELLATSAGITQAKGTVIGCITTGPTANK
jgi:Mrp family chromosome partitioning ATPase